jgi:hypothetical protein
MAMRSKISALLFAVFAATSVTAQADVDCKDGTTSTVSGRGACSHHGGVVKDSGERTRAPKPTQGRRKAPKADTERSAPREESWLDKWLGPKDEDQPRTQPRRSGERTHSTKKRQAGEPTALCRDGEMSYALHHRGACSGHGGVARWLD